MAEGEHDVEPAGDVMDVSDDASVASATVVDVTEAPDDAPVTTSAVVVARKRVSRRPAARKAKVKAEAKKRAKAEAKGRARATLRTAAPKKPAAKVKRTREVRKEETPKQDREENEIGPSATAPAAGGTGLVRLGPADFAVWLDATLAAALTDKDRKRLNKVLKRAAKRGKKRQAGHR